MPKFTFVGQIKEIGGDLRLPPGAEIVVDTSVCEQSEMRIPVTMEFAQQAAPLLYKWVEVTIKMKVLEDEDGDTR